MENQILILEGKATDLIMGTGSAQHEGIGAYPEKD